MGQDAALPDDVGIGPHEQRMFLPSTSWCGRRHPDTVEGVCEPMS
ncbi:hypothetical protein ACWEKV_09030 [Janibacter hoylei]